MSNEISGENNPDQNIINSKVLFKSLNDLGCCESDLAYLNEYIRNRNVYDISGYNGITTFVVPEDENNKEEIVVKISKGEGDLYDEYVITELVGKHGYGPEIIDYFSSNKDYLITKLIKSECVIDIKDINIVAQIMGKCLREFHDISWKNFNIEEKEILSFNLSNHLDDILNNTKNEYSDIYKNIQQLKTLYQSNDVIVHGSFSPRNVFVKDGKLDKVVGFANTHYGDRHYDIFYAIWSIGFHFGILDNQEEFNKMKELFLNSYGLDLIDEKRFELCGYLMCLHYKDNININKFQMIKK